MSKQKKVLDSERRGHLKNKNESAYSECVMKMIQLRESTQMQLVKEVCDTIGLGETDFMQSLEIHASNPQMGPFIQAAQGGKLKQPTAVTTPSLSKEKVIQCIECNITMFKNPETGRKIHELSKNVPQDPMQA